MVFSSKTPKSLLFEIISLKYLVWRIKILCDKELINELINGVNRMVYTAESAATELLERKNHEPLFLMVEPQNLYNVSHRSAKRHTTVCAESSSRVCGVFFLTFGRKKHNIKRRRAKQITGDWCCRSSMFQERLDKKD
jgi:hypothetical protein